MIMWDLFVASLMAFFSHRIRECGTKLVKNSLIVWSSILLPRSILGPASTKYWRFVKLLSGNGWICQRKCGGSQRNIGNSAFNIRDADEANMPQ